MGLNIGVSFLIVFVFFLGYCIYSSKFVKRRDMYFKDSANPKNYAVELKIEDSLWQKFVEECPKEEELVGYFKRNLEF
jgi:fructose-specific phosphotransferase system IIC component